MANQVLSQPEGYLEIQIDGDQSYESMHSVLSQAQPAIEKLQDAGKPILALIDLGNLRLYDSGSNKAAFEVLEQTPYKKVALIGATRVLHGVMDMIILAIGKRDNTRMFDSREEALAWLLA